MATGTALGLADMTAGCMVMLVEGGKSGKCLFDGGAGVRARKAAR